MQLVQLIYTHFRLGVLNELQYRANFWIQLLQTALGLATSIGGLLVVFRHSSTLGGWYPDELLVLVGIYFLMRGAIYSVVQPSMEFFMQDVRLGTLDYALIKPVDSQLLVSIRRVSIWNLFDGLAGIGIIVIALGRSVWTHASNFVYSHIILWWNYRLQFLAYTCHVFLLVCQSGKHSGDL